MDGGAYFVGRTELLKWINTTLGLHLTKIEQCAPGYVACQLMDVLHPGAVPLSKVNFAAKNEYEYVNNYKILQSTFDKLSIPKVIEVNKLIKGKALDNLEFMQWLKKHFDSTVGTGKRVEDYDPEARRVAAGGKIVPATSGSTAPPRPAPARPASARLVSARSPGIVSANGPNTSRTSSRIASGRATPAAVAVHVDSAQIDALNEEITQLKLNVDGIEKERDFYFSKLRDVEILCQMAEFKELPVVKAVIQILYASDENVDVLQIAQTAIEKTHSGLKGEEAGLKDEVEDA
jgi:RP/EB family microtubule-associated protein